MKDSARGNIINVQYIYHTVFESGRNQNIRIKSWSFPLNDFISLKNCNK